MERERGISITSTVLQFPYQGHIINLLDTPGHQDFSEDTYRTLAAVDSAVMVLDAAKGIEPQTRKLYAVCRQRGIPIFAFVNKMDRPARSPLGLLDEIEEVLGRQPVPLNWPLGDGEAFRGVYDRRQRGVYIHQRTERNERMAPEQFFTVESLLAAGVAREALIREVQADIELLDALDIRFQARHFLADQQMPVFFGSALTNFGVRLFLDAFVELAPPPQPFASSKGLVSPADDEFSGFIFKIQANMNPRHRDSVAFVRVCSGRFERGMEVIHAQTGKTYRLRRPYRLFANEREIIEEAHPGDVVGIPNAGGFAIGDTLYQGDPFHFAPIPRFHPEYFALLRNRDVAKQKQFRKGLQQLETEGAVQVLYNVHALNREPILAAVGELQFDLVQARLENEYNVPTLLDRLHVDAARWVAGPERIISHVADRSYVLLCRDVDQNHVVLFKEPGYLRATIERFPQLKFETRG